MAKKSKIAKNEQRKALVAKYADRRAALKEIVRDPKTAPADQQLAIVALSKLPRNANPTRIRNRCVLTGRPRGVHRKFKLCRNALRDLASSGALPGVVKSSW